MCANKLLGNDDLMGVSICIYNPELLQRLIRSIDAFNLHERALAHAGEIKL